MPWSASEYVQKAPFDDVAMRPRRKRRRDLGMATIRSDAKINNDPVAVAPMLAQPSKPRSRGLLGQARLAKSMGSGARDPRTHRNAQRFAGASDWLGEGLTLADDQTIQTHWSAQTLTNATASKQITAQLVRCNPSTIGFSCTLPDLREWTSPVIVKNATGYTSTITVETFNENQTIEGRSHETLTEAWGSRIFIPDGSHWFVVSLTSLNQYLLIDGSRAMTGDLNMGTKAITNVGNVDGVDVSVHATRHQSGGADSIKLDDLAAPEDNTDLNVSTTAHGLMVKAPNSTAQWFRGDASWATVPGRLLAFTVYVTGSGNHTWNTNTTAALIRVVGGGGGGGGVSGGAAQSAAAGGGGAGACVEKYTTGLTGGATAAYAVGAGGAGGTAGANNGSNGTDSTFTLAVALTAGGGVGGTAMAAGTALGIAAGGSGGTASNGDINISGGDGGPGFRVSASGGLSGYGGGSFTGGGPRGIANAAGNAGAAYGAGGGGAATVGNTDRAGGDGKVGCIMVWEFA